MVHVHDIKTNDAGDDAKRLFAVGGHMTTTTLNQLVITKWSSEMERAG